MIISQEQVDYCMECGVCTASCPISRILPRFSPRQMIKRALMDCDDTILAGHELWACLTCARCSSRCPAQIDFPEFARSYRALARDRGHMPQLSHHGTLQAITALQTRRVKQCRTEWVGDAGRFSSTGDFFYFVGCAPFFEAVLKPGEGSLAAAGVILTLLNRMGIEPVISENERCCGHDALWSGDEVTFRKLAKLNLQAIRESGAKTVLFGCPEGYMTFKEHVPRYFGELPFEVLHISEFLAKELPGLSLQFKPPDNEDEAVVTYQDPCRLGRRARIYEEPRQLIGLIPNIRLEEMPRNRESALCCGTSAWMECSNWSKSMQVERLEEAISTGAKTLLTACPKCRIHLVCAQSNTDIRMSVVDLYSFLLHHLQAAVPGK